MTVLFFRGCLSMTGLKVYTKVRDRFRIECINPSNAEATFTQCTRTQDFYKPSNPCHIGFHWIAFTEHSQMSTHMPDFHISAFSHHFILPKLATSSIRVKETLSVNGILVCC